MNKSSSLLMPKSNVVVNKVRQDRLEISCVSQHHEYLSRIMNTCGRAQMSSNKEVNARYGKVGK